jgi:translocation and assembly module TamB
LRRAGRALGGLLGLLLVLILVVLLALQTDWGARQATDLILARVPLEDATLTVGDVDGTWLSSLRLYDVTLTRDDTTRLAHLDTLEARYALWPLLQKRLHVREALVSGLDVTMQQRADSSWNLLDVFPTAAEEDTTPSAFVLQFDDVTLRSTRLRADFYAPGRDSTLRVERLDVQLDDLLLDLSDAPSLQQGRLATRVVPPGTETPFDLDASASLVDRRLTLQALQLRSPRSMLTAGGTLRLPADDTTGLSDIDVQLTADPVAFGDLHPFLPTLDPEASATLDLRVAGSSEQLTARAEGTLSDGGRLDLDATVTPALDGPVTYRVDADVQRLDPSLFTGPSATPTRISASLTADLSGPSLDALGGTLRAEVFDTRFGDYAPDRTTLTAQVDSGLARVDVQTGLRGARLAANGTLRPFAEVPTYDLRGRLADVDLGAFVDDPAQSSDLDASFVLSGRGFSLSEADTRFTLTLDPSRINQYRLDGGTLAAAYADSTLDLDAKMQIPEGRIAAAGQVRLGDVLRYRIDRGRIDNLDVAALMGDTTRSRLTGTFALRGQGTDPATLRLDSLRLRLEDSVYGPYRLRRAEAMTTLARGRLDLRTTGALDGGAFDLTATARPFAAVPTYEITDGRFEGVHLGTLTQNPDLTTDLNGTLTLDGRGVDPDRLALTARLGLVDSQYNQQYIDTGTVTARLADGTLDVEAQLDLPDGMTRLAGTVTGVFSDAPTIVTREGRFQGLNLGAFLGDASLQTALSGSLSVDGTVPLDSAATLPATSRLAARLTLDRSTINRAVVDSGLVTIDLDEGQTRLRARLDLDEGRAELDVSGRLFDAVPTYQVSGRLDRLDLARLTGIDTLQADVSLDLTAEGMGLDPRTMTLDAQITQGSGRYGSATLDRLQTTLSVRDGVVRVDTLALASNVLRADGGGTITLFDGPDRPPSDFRLDATLRDLAPLRPFLGAQTLALDEGAVEARLYGAPGALRFDAETRLASLAYDDLRIAGVDLRVAGALTDSLRLDRAEVTGAVNYLSVPQFSVQDVRLESTYTPDSLQFAVESIIDRDNEARLSGVADLRPDRQQIVLDAFNVRFGPDRWQLLQEATISYGDAYRVSNFLIYTGNQQIALDGVVDLDGTQSLILTIEGFRIGAVASLLDYEGLDGTLFGTLDLTGPAEAPNLAGTLNFDVTSFDDPVGDLRLSVRYDSLRLNLDSQLTHVDGSTLTLGGFVPLDLRLRPPTGDEADARPLSLTRPEDQALRLRLQADAFAIGWIEPFLDRSVISSVDGRLTADVQVEGTLGTPRLAGEAMLAKARVGLPELDLTYRDIQMDLTFENEQVVLNHAEVTSGGSLVAMGTVDLAELTLGNFDIDASLEDFRAIDTREYRGVVSGDLRLRGTTQAPVLGGDLQVVSADVYLTEATTSEEFAPVTLEEQDLRMLEQRFGIRVGEADTTTFDFYQALAIDDLNVDLERNVWLRSPANPEMNIQFTGDLDLQKAPNEDILLFGTIDVLEQRSYINQFGRRFNLTSGLLTFNGAADAPYLNLEAEYDVPSRRNRGNEITILLSLEGQPDDLDTQLSSDPPTDLTNIVSYIATGRPASEAFQLGGEGTLATQGAGLALNQLAGIVEGVAGSGLGLDVIEIRQNGLTGTTITAGKYLTQRLYVEVSQPISFGGTTSQESGTTSGTNATRVFAIEYELFEWLLARANGDGTGSNLEFNLLWEYAY